MSVLVVVAVFVDDAGGIADVATLPWDMMKMDATIVLALRTTRVCQLWFQTLDDDDESFC